MPGVTHAGERQTTDWFHVDPVNTGKSHYETLAGKRCQTPVEAAAPFLGGTEPVFVAYRYADVARIVSDEATFSSDIVATKYRAVLGRRTMMALGPRELRRFRSVLGATLGRRNVAALTADILAPVIDPIAAALSRRSEADLVAEVTSVVPALVLARLMGMEPETAPLLLRHALAMAGYLDAPKQAIQGSRALRKLFRQVVEDRHRKPRDDLVSRLIFADGADEPPPDEDVIAVLLLLAWAGTETAYPGLGSLLLALLAHPDQLQAVRASTTLAHRAVDEALRWEAPVQATARSVARDTMIGTVPVPKGATLFAHLGSANHDLPGIADPERFDIWHTSTSPHLAFGLGMHRCIGSHLARAEMVFTLEQVLAACPRLRLANPGATTITGSFVRGPLHLPVEIT